MSVVAALLISTGNVSGEVADWQWDPETPICRLRHELSSGGMIELGRTPANDETELRITLPPAPNFRAGHYDDAVLATLPGAKSVADVSIERDEKRRLRIYVVTPDPIFIESLSNASSLEISHEKVAPIRMAIESPAAATAALRACEDRKMLAWGIDPASWRALRSRPFPLKPARDRFSAMDYPPDALRQGIEADAITRLDVTTDGRVGECKSLNPGAYRGFEQAACSVLKGALFRPAVDSSGNSVMAPVIYDVIFRVDDR